MTKQSMVGDDLKDVGKISSALLAPSAPAAQSSGDSSQYVHPPESSAHAEAKSGDSTEPLFPRNIHNILENKCFSCHAEPKKREDGIQIGAKIFSIGDFVGYPFTVKAKSFPMPLEGGEIPPLTESELLQLQVYSDSLVPAAGR